MINIAHRGANREALENSIQAFELAVETGADRIELDVQLSLDDEIYIMHDDSLLKTVGQALHVSELTSAQLDKLRLKNEEKIPKLKDVCADFLERIELNIEIKGPRPKLAELSAKLVKDSKYKDKVIFSSFHTEPLVHLQNRFPHEFHIAALWGEDTLYIDPIYHIAPQLMMLTCRTHIIHPEVAYVSENFMDQANARGWTVYPWVPMVGVEDGDRENLWNNLSSLGVHGLCTNFCREFTEWRIYREQSSLQYA